MLITPPVPQINVDLSGSCDFGVRIFLSTQALLVATPPTLIWGVQWACCVSAFEYIVHVRYPVLFSSRHPTLLEKSRGGPPEEADEEGKEMEGGDQRIGKEEKDRSRHSSAPHRAPRQSSALFGTPPQPSNPSALLGTPWHCHAVRSPATPC